MNIDDENQQSGVDPQTADQTPDATIETSKWKALFAKRWAFPALYLTAAAMIIAFMYFQATRFVNGGQTATPQNNQQVVTTSATNWIWPIGGDAKGVQVLRGYYDRTVPGVTVAALTKDLVHSGNSYSGSTGYDLGVPNATRAFDVVAANSGTVTDVSTSPVWGLTVTLDTGNGYSAVYRSLGTVDVQKGARVLQGQQIGTSGKDQLEADLGNHLFFAVEKNGVVINPASVLPKQHS